MILPALPLTCQSNLIGAGTGNNRFATVRYHNDGSLDDTFGVNGIVHEEDVGFFASAVGIQNDGKIVVAGLGYGMALIRYHPDGSRDTSFGSNGVIDTGPPLVAAWDMIIQPDGKIVAVGTAAAYEDDTLIHNMIIVRFNHDGSWDTDFGDDGQVILDFGQGHDEALGVALQTDGKILVAGYANTTISAETFTLLRLTTNGELDAGFGEDGITNSGGCCRAQGLTLQDDNKIVVTGYGSNMFLTARFENDPLSAYNDIIYLPAIMKP